MTNGSLRDTFTQNICQKLMDGFSLNVYCEKQGQGLSRLVQDIAQAKKEDARIARINMKSYTSSYSGFISDLAGQLKVGGNEALEMETLIGRFLETHPRKVLLLLENFDALFVPGIDAKYDIQFVNYLNSLRNKDNVGLLLTTRKKISTEAIYFEGKLGSGSMIDLSDRVELLRLTLPQIEEELYRLAANNSTLQNYLRKNAALKNLFVGAIDKHPQCYHFLGFVYSKLENLSSPEKNVQEIERLISQWQKEYQKGNHIAFGKHISKWKKGVNYVSFHTNEIFGMHNALQKVKAKWLIIGGSLIAVGYTLYQYGEKIMAWFN